MTPDPTTHESLLADTRWLHQLLVGLVGDSHAAEDLHQEALLAAWSHTSKGPLTRSWLSRVARNLAATFRIRAARRTRVEGELASEGVSTAPPDLIMEAELQGHAVDAVLSLDEPYRTTVLLRFMKGRSLDEVADEMSVPTETVRTRQRRALEFLRKKLGVREQQRAWLPIAWPTWAKGTVVMMMSKKSAIATVSILVLLAIGWLVNPLPLDVQRVEPLQSVALDPFALKTKGIDVEAPSVAATTQRSPVGTTETGTIEITLTWKETGEPAEAIPVNLATRMGLPGVIRSSNSLGTIRYEDMLPGRYFLGSLHSRLDDEFSLEAGESVHRTHSLDTELQGMVTVVDRERNPVAGALVVGATLVSRPWPFPLGRTNEQGQLSFRGLSSFHMVSAISKTLGTSPHLLLLKEVIGGNTTLPLTLTLPGTASSISGRVYGPGGAPEFGAHVLVDYGRGSASGPGDHYWKTPSPAMTRTDEEGAFQLDGLLTGDAQLVVLAEELAPYSRQIALDHGPLLDQVITLEAGALVRWRVMDEQGKALAKSSARITTACSFKTYDTKIATDGFFYIEHVPSGPFEIEISSSNHSPWQKTLTIVDGAAYEFEAVLTSRGELQRFRLMDREGQPLAKWVFNRNANRTGQTDAQGFFELVMIDGRHDDIHFRRSTEEIIGPLVHTFGPIEAQAGVITLTVPAERMPNSWLSGRLVGSGNEPLMNLHVAGIQLDMPPALHGIWQTNSQTNDSGSFRIGPLPQGRYQLFISGARTVFRDHEIALGVSDEHDFGTLHGVRAASLKLLPNQDSSDTPSEHVLLDEQNQVHRSDPGIENHLIFGSLYPGTYRIAVIEDGEQRIVSEVVLLPGDMHEFQLGK